MQCILFFYFHRVYCYAQFLLFAAFSLFLILSFFYLGLLVPSLHLCETQAPLTVHLDTLTENRTLDGRFVFGSTDYPLITLGKASAR